MKKRKEKKSKISCLERREKRDERMTRHGCVDDGRRTTNCAFSHWHTSDQMLKIGRWRMMDGASHTRRCHHVTNRRALPSCLFLLLISLSFVVHIENRDIYTCLFAESRTFVFLLNMPHHSHHFFPTHFALVSLSSLYTVLRPNNDRCFCLQRWN